MKVEKDPRPLVCPNPVVLMTTVDANMRPNAITLTLVGAVCGQPPMIGIRIGVEQHSRSLIDEKGEVDLGKADPILFNLTNSYWEIGKKLADYGSPVPEPDNKKSGYLSLFPWMKSSTQFLAMSSLTWVGGCLKA